MRDLFICLNRVQIITKFYFSLDKSKSNKKERTVKAVCRVLLKVMKFKKVDNKYLIRVDKGEEIVDTLKQFCKDNGIKLGSINGIGAINKATIGLFKTATKEYSSKELTGDYEITALNGNISTMKGEVYLHLHINLSDLSYRTYGGHLNSAIVSATCEIIIDVINTGIEREFSEEIGLNLYEL